MRLPQGPLAKFPGWAQGLVVQQNPYADVLHLNGSDLLLACSIYQEAPRISITSTLITLRSPPQKCTSATGPFELDTADMRRLELPEALIAPCRAAGEKRANDHDGIVDLVVEENAFHRRNRARDLFSTPAAVI